MNVALDQPDLPIHTEPAEGSTAGPLPSGGSDGSVASGGGPLAREDSLPGEEAGR